MKGLAIVPIKTSSPTSNGSIFYFNPLSGFTGITLHYHTPTDTTKYSYKHKIRSWFQDYKQGLECSKCGYSNNTHESFNVKALEFHHTDDNKEFAVSEGVCNGLSMKRIIKEIKKCQVLCARCHAEHHYEVRK